MKLKVALALSLAMAFGCALAETADIVTVKGRGVGEDMASALKDAYRDAIETAVGLYVDAEQMVKNDELLKDQVLTQSNAYIEGYDVLSKKVGDGMVSIKIIAKVKTRPLTKKVSGFMKPRTVEVGSALRDQFAKSATERKRGEEGAALIKKALDALQIGQMAMDCQLMSPDGKVVSDDGKSVNVNVRYLLGFKINEERFFAMIQPLCPIFDQVSIEEPQDMLIPVKRDTPFDILNCQDYFQDKMELKGDFRFNGCGFAIDGPATLIVVTGVNKLRTVYKAKKYFLDKYSAAVVRTWVRGSKQPSFRMTFYDDAGEALHQLAVSYSFFAWHGICSHCTRISFRSESASAAFITPWCWYYDGAIGGGYIWQTMSIPRVALPEIKSIKIEAEK